MNKLVRYYLWIYHNSSWIQTGSVNGYKTYSNLLDKNSEYMKHYECKILKGEEI